MKPKWGTSIGRRLSLRWSTRGVRLVSTIVIVTLPIGGVGIGTIRALLLGLGLGWTLLIGIIPIVHRVTPLVDRSPGVRVIHHRRSLGWGLR